MENYKGSWKRKKNWMFHKVFLKIGETYALSKFYTQSFKSGATQKNNIFSMTLTVRVNYWYTLWNVEPAVSNPLENQK